MTDRLTDECSDRCIHDGGDLPPPQVAIIVRCAAIEGAYDRDGTRIERIILEPGDDVRLRFDGKTLHFNDSGDEK